MQQKRHGIIDTGLKLHKNYHKKHKKNIPACASLGTLLEDAHVGILYFFPMATPGLSDKGFHVNKLSSEFLKRILGFFLGNN